MLYELEDESITPLGRVEGKHPFGFFQDGKHMYVTLKKIVFLGFQDFLHYVSIPYRYSINHSTELKKHREDI